MRRPKRKLSRLAGEKQAEQHDLFPVDVRSIAADEGIEIIGLQSESMGVTGGITFTEPPVIFHTEKVNNEGFLRFTIAHELGHYFLPGHPDEIMNKGGEHLSMAASGSKVAIEIEADQVATGLLMPSKRARPIFENTTMGLAGIEALAEAANVSLIAAALRLLAIDPYPAAVCSTKGDEVIFCSLSESMRDLGCRNWPRKGDRVPSGTATAAFNEDTSNPVQLFSRTHLSEWMDIKTDLPIDEQIVSQSRYEGRTLTIITGEALVAQMSEETNEDEDIEESWKVSFRR